VRFGGGTRIKTLEAFAHRRPVVSTTVGCEGIDAVDGVHALLADDPAALAASCVRLLEDRDLGRSLTDAAFGLYSAAYRTDRIRPVVTSLAVRVAERGRTAARSERPGPLRAGGARR
jgi:glycosyltransferase involved in cell wall biosynthesis